MQALDSAEWVHESQLLWSLPTPCCALTANGLSCWLYIGAFRDLVHRRLRPQRKYRQLTERHLPATPEAALHRDAAQESVLKS